MQTLERPPLPARPLVPREIPTPGSTRQPVGFLAGRTLEVHAAFVLPLLDRGLEVLDVGCRAGTITQGLAEHVLPGRVTGVDPDPDQVTLASRLAEGRELTNVRFTSGSAYELPFGEAAFDLVFSHALFEHLSNPRGALRELRRVLRPGGLVALSSPDWDAFEMRGASPEALMAMRAFRDLQERNGVDTAAGGNLLRWLRETEFGLIRQGETFETHDAPMRLATSMALQLDAAGNPGAARALLDWSTEPGAELRGCWRHVIGIKWNR